MDLRKRVLYFVGNRNRSISSIKKVQLKPNPSYLFVDGLAAIHIANSDIINAARSANKCAASVAIAKLLDKTPPIISTIINITHKILAVISFFLARLSISFVRSVWQWPEKKKIEIGFRFVRMVDVDAKNMLVVAQIYGKKIWWNIYWARYQTCKWKFIWIPMKNVSFWHQSQVIVIDLNGKYFVCVSYLYSKG